MNVLAFYFKLRSSNSNINPIIKRNRGPEQLSEIHVGTIFVITDKNKLAQLLLPQTQRTPLGYIFSQLFLWFTVLNLMM